MEDNASIVSDVISERIVCRPFLKWVGGKSQLITQIRQRLPQTIKRYYEPFIGGGALFFSLQPKHAYISDLNYELINAYQVVKNDVEALIEDLRRHTYEKEYYYLIRNSDRTEEFATWSSVARASRIIFLNKTCFNGLYRVNSKGQFNTPIGKYLNPTILDEKNLRACSEALKNTEIQHASFEALEERITAEDFVYFDPPYVPLTVTSNFTGYSSEGFSLQKQQDLYALCCRLHARGIKFLLSNSSAPLVLDLYKEFNIQLVAATRFINSKATGRGAVSEVLVSNY